MGVRAELLEIPAEQIVDIERGATVDQNTLAKCPHTFLDVSWRELHLLFREMEYPLNRIVSGEREFPAGSPTFDAFIGGRGEYYSAITSPPLVREIAVALAALSESELIRAGVEKGIALDSYMSEILAELKATYSRAAANGAVLWITMA